MTKTTSGLTVRPYISSDYSDVRQNLQESGVYFKPLDSEEIIARKIERSPDSILVAEIDGAVVGNIIIVNDWGALLFRLSVREGYRNRGVGSELIESAEQHLRNEGYSEANILVAEGDKELKKYYKHRGYKEGSVYRWMYKEF